MRRVISLPSNCQRNLVAYRQWLQGRRQNEVAKINIAKSKFKKGSAGFQNFHQSESAVAQYSENIAKVEKSKFKMPDAKSFKNSDSDKVPYMNCHKAIVEAALPKISAFI